MSDSQEPDASPDGIQAALVPRPRGLPDGPFCARGRSSTQGPHRPPCLAKGTKEFKTGGDKGWLSDAASHPQKQPHQTRAASWRGGRSDSGPKEEGGLAEQQGGPFVFLAAEICILRSILRSPRLSGNQSFPDTFLDKLRMAGSPVRTPNSSVTEVTSRVRGPEARKCLAPALCDGAPLTWPPPSHRASRFRGQQSGETQPVRNSHNSSRRKSRLGPNGS